MSGGKGDTPDPPDYAAAAKEQGVANVNSALATSFLNQANQVGPNGSLTYSYDYNNAYTLPDGTRIPLTTATTTLSPEQQHLYDQNMGISSQLNDLASSGIDYVGQAVGQPAIPAGLGSLQQGVDRTNFSGTAAPTTQPIAGSYDFSNVTAMPNRDEFNSARDEVTNAYMARLQPYIDHDRDALQTRLANQGITTGSQASNYDQDTFNRGVNDQRIAALLSGDQEAQRLFSNAMQMRGQGVNEAIQQGNFGNSAQAQQFGQNQTALQNQNTAAQANYAQGLSSAQFNNQARAQAIQEADYARNAPLNTLNALRTGNQATIPTFGNVTAGANIAPAPVYQAAADQYQAALQNYQLQQQQNSGFLSGLASLGSAGIMVASDRRLKKNISKIGLFVKGIPLYLFQYLWGEWKIGVMADEVPTEFLGPTVGGYQTVNGALYYAD